MAEGETVVYINIVVHTIVSLWLLQSSSKHGTATATGTSATATGTSATAGTAQTGGKPATTLMPAKAGTPVGWSGKWIFVLPRKT